MKNYFVRVPISGFVEVEVQAESESEAIDKAFDSEDLNLENVGEWEVHEHICTGNVCHASLTDIECYEE